MEYPAKLYSLLILAALKLYSDREHPLTSEQVCQKLLSGPAMQSSLTPKTVRTQLTVLYDTFLFEASYLTEAYGGTLHCLIKNSLGHFLELSEFEESSEAANQTKKTRYYYWEPAVSRDEWSLFQNMILCNQYLSVSQTRDLYNLTERMKNPLSPLRYSPEHNRKYKQNDLDIFKTLSLLQSQITKKQRVLMQYGEYHNSTSLSPRGELRLINPYAILSTNGYLYLIATPANKPERITNFRIDRILSLSLPSEDQQKREEIPAPLQKYFPNADHSFLDAPLYRNEHPVMYAGEIAHIKLLCDSAILNNVIDDFGLNLRIETKHPYQPTDWLLITMNASLKGTEVFCTRHCCRCRILSPKRLKKALLETLQEGLTLNSGCEENSSD